MSKKDRLKAQAEKQKILQKEIEEQERLEKEEAQYKQSKSARKMMKKAKRARHGREPAAFILLKLLMLIPYGYSGIFYGSVLAFGVFGGYIEPKPPSWVGWCALAGTVVIGAGIIVEFFKKHVPSFIVICAGTLVFLKAAEYMIDDIQNKLETRKVDEALMNMDKQYMRYYYPITAVSVLSLIILAAWIIMKIVEKKRIQHIKDTAPVKSVVD